MMWIHVSSKSFMGVLGLLPSLSILYRIALFFFFLISGATEAAFAEAVGDRRRSWVYIV